MAANDQTRTLIPLGTYQWPVRPTEDTVRRIAGGLWQKLRRTKSAEPFISDDAFQDENRKSPDQRVASPATGDLLREIDTTLSQWISNQEPASWLRLIVLPPCDQNNLVRSWAVNNNYFIAEPPPRDSLTQGNSIQAISGKANGRLIVVPQLECWFLRHRNGLKQVRCLLSELAAVQQHCVVSCNSWAWTLLKKAANAEAVLPTGLTFESFQATRLRDWLFEQTLKTDNAGCKFRLAKSGEDLFERTKDRQTTHPFFKKLAAQSLGIPWVAWHLWRQSIRLESLQHDKAEPGIPAEKTVWLTSLDDFPLPTSNIDSVHLILHALLIHGCLTTNQLASVLPNDNDIEALPALVKNGCVIHEEANYRCSPAAYPTIRSALNDAGYPTDQL